MCVGVFKRHLLWTTEDSFASVIFVLWIEKITWNLLYLSLENLWIDPSYSIFVDQKYLFIRLIVQLIIISKAVLKILFITACLSGSSIALVKGRNSMGKEEKSDNPPRCYRAARCSKFLLRSRGLHFFSPRCLRASFAAPLRQAVSSKQNLHRVTTFGTTPSIISDQNDNKRKDDGNSSRPLAR